MQIAAIASAAIALLIEVFLHRFQRATLAVANLQTEGKGGRQEIARLQMAMMPDWVGAVVVLEKLAAAIAAVLLYLAYSWWGVVVFAILYLPGIFAGVGGVFIPFLPYSWYLRSIERHLEKCRIKLVTEQLLPAGATVDLIESMDLGRVVQELAEGAATGTSSVEAIAAGRIVGQCP
jgi:hypothetical protein